MYTSEYEFGFFYFYDPNYEYEYERDLDGEDDVGERGPYKAGRRECYP